ncbi:GNAT family N-acetyltransferase [Streptomonospora algeriensis]|uniref:GNAT family N-acetyltransferase n=1 Tax=Streptomonospora algeriensis TaxID=995084 RepID=A0ABW3BAL1_9ACTN
MNRQGGSLIPEPVLEDGTVRLRRWAATDLSCVKAASDEGVIPGGTTVPVVFTEEAGREWIERQHSRTGRGQGWSLAVTEISRGQAVGCAVLLLRPQEGVAGLGYWIAPEARGRGVASRAVALLTEWGLREPGLARVEAWVEPGNAASTGVLSRCGFEYEGRLRLFLSFPTRRADAWVFSRIGAA